VANREIKCRDLGKSPACRQTRRSSTIGADLTIIEKIAFIEKTGEEEAAILEKIGQRWPRWHTDLSRKN
jgi:hypothetical protein